MEILQTAAVALWSTRRDYEKPKTPVDIGESSTPLQTAGGEMTAKPWLSEPGFEEIGTMAEYISIKKLDSALLLELIKIELTAFKKELRSIIPEVSTEDLSFTLGPDDRLILLNLPEKLPPDVRSRLTDAINNFRSLKEMVKNYALNTELLRQLQPESLNLGRLNDNDIYKAIDYGNIVPDSHMSQAWDHQVERYLSSAISSGVDINV